jgi:hypothetical protein
VTDEAWIKALLHRAPMAVFATVRDNQPFVNSNLFVFDETANLIYFHTAAQGRTRTNIETAEKVCVSVSEMGRLLPATEAMQFSVEYAGVTVFGSARIVSDSTEAKYGLQLLLDKYFPHLTPGQDYRPTTAGELRLTSVFRVDIESWSGKQKRADADFPGAFQYGQP